MTIEAPAVESSTLDQACSLITDGTHYSPANTADGEYLYITSKNVRLGALDLSNVSRVRADVHREIYKGCPVLKGDVLLVKDGVNAGTAALNTLDEPFSMLSSVALIRPNPAVLDARYLVHWLNSPSGYAAIIRGRSGSAITRIVLREIRRCSVPIVPVSQQRRIAEMLDKVDALRAKRRAALALLDALTQSIFLDMFGDRSSRGWPMSTVDEMALPVDGAIRTGPFGSQLLHSEFVDEGVAVIGIDNVVTNEFSWGQRRFISEGKYRGLARYRVKPDDVLITIMGTCGRCAVVPADVPLAINTKHLCCITLDKRKCVPSFLHAYFLRHPHARRYLHRAAKGAIMSGLNMGIIKAMPVPLAPIELQEEFASYQEKLNALRTSHRAWLAEAEALFTSLQHSAFRGEL